MPFCKPTFHDRKGDTHKVLDEATVSDLTQVFEGEDKNGMAIGFARTVLAHRATIEEIFAEHDAAAAKMKEQG